MQVVRINLFIRVGGAGCLTGLGWVELEATLPEISLVAEERVPRGAVRGVHLDAETLLVVVLLADNCDSREQQRKREAHGPLVKNAERPKSGAFRRQAQRPNSISTARCDACRGSR